MGGQPVGARVNRLLPGLCLVALLSHSPMAPALEKPEAPEYSVKASLLLNLLPYVQWPSSADAGEGPFELVVLGKSPFGSHLDEELSKLTVHHRVIRVRYVSKLVAAEGCQALFICASESRRVDDILAWSKGRQILTMADDGRMAGRGVMINLLLEEQKVRLAVNLEAVRASGFSLSSRLLPLARIIAPPAPVAGQKG
jgi:hypothetical protein